MILANIIECYQSKTKALRDYAPHSPAQFVQLSPRWAIDGQRRGPSPGPAVTTGQVILIPKPVSKEKSPALACKFDIKSK